MKKNWGEVTEIFRNDSCSVSVLHINAGGECSYHFHRSKYNKFYVISGKITIWAHGFEKTLLTDAVLEIPPGTIHYFKALEESVVIETTFVKDDIEDIVRLQLFKP